MLDNFKVFADAVRTQFIEMSNVELFEIRVERDGLWASYLASFPAGSDPIYLTRTEHDCSCCKNFMRDIGGVVAIQNGAYISVWNVTGLPEPYQTVADKMAAYVTSHLVDNVFLATKAKIGVLQNSVLVDDNDVTKGTKTFSHFNVVVPKKFVCRKIPTVRGEKRMAAQVLIRGVKEITPQAVDTVLGLIADKAIYRGTEFDAVVQAFKRLQQQFLTVAGNPVQENRWKWENIDVGAGRIRNTAIGTLLRDLSAGMDEDEAIRRYEFGVAPTNYKRPTTIITEGMVTKALATVTALGLQSALERRHARFEDVSVSSVLFVDNSVRNVMRDPLHTLLMGDVKPKVQPIAQTGDALDISIDDFVARVLPNATTLEATLDNNQSGNFMLLTALTHSTLKTSVVAKLLMLDLR